jgi:hypothetical protein
MTDYINTSLRLLETASTKTNTGFSPWWLALNGEPAKRNMPEARYGDARDYYETGHSPKTAADDIVATMKSITSGVIDPMPCLLHGPHAGIARADYQETTHDRCHLDRQPLHRSLERDECQPPVGSVSRSLD